MSLTPALPISIAPRPAVRWGGSYVYGRIINEVPWLDIDCQFQLDSDAERTELSGMVGFSAPLWLGYFLPVPGYSIRLKSDPQHAFIGASTSNTSAKFEAALIDNNSFSTAPAFGATPPAWLRCTIPVAYTSQQLPTHGRQVWSSNRTRTNERMAGKMHDVGLTVQGISRARFFEFLGWWSEGVGFGTSAFSLPLPGVGSSARLLDWKASKRSSLFDITLDLRVV